MNDYVWFENGCINFFNTDGERFVVILANVFECRFVCEDNDVLLKVTFTDNATVHYKLKRMNKDEQI
jgi:hypothetical protein